MTGPERPCLAKHINFMNLMQQCSLLLSLLILSMKNILLIYLNDINKSGYRLKVMNNNNIIKMKINYQ